MAEYITKQEVRLALLQRFWKPNEWHDIKSLISSIPPADVRPVVRGKWKFKNTDAHTLDVRTCSVCGLKKVFITNFCPSCGADMMGGDAE